jgi:hypothetical protein
LTLSRIPPALLLLVGLNFLWLFSPPPIRYMDSCGPYYPLNRYMGLMVHCDCDSIKFVEMARDPRALLDPDEIQKSRRRHGWCFMSSSTDRSANHPDRPDDVVATNFWGCRGRCHHHSRNGDCPRYPRKHCTPCHVGRSAIATWQEVQRFGV